MFYFLLLTALTVSIDSFVCGFSLSLSNKRKLPIILTITLTVLAMCFFTNYLTLFFSDKLSEKTVGLGGLLLVLIGVYNLFKKSNDTINKPCNFKQILLVGFAVGLDGALANLSLSLMGINDIYVPIVIAVTHGVLIGLGITLSQTKISKHLFRYSFFAPMILIALGLYKFLSAFL